MSLRRVAATRYVAALREGGSLPGLVEADDDGSTCRVPRRRARRGRAGGGGRGGRAGARARLPVPELVVVDVAPELGRAEPDPEIQDLTGQPRAERRHGLPARRPAADRGGRPRRGPALAADVVWFDALVTNVDRTYRNPNLLVWHEHLWLIDHGASFFRQYGETPLPRPPTSRPMLADHVLLAVAGPIADADARLADARSRRSTAPSRPCPRSARRRTRRPPRRPQRFPGARLRRRAHFVEEAERARG